MTCTHDATVTGAAVDTEETEHWHADPDAPTTCLTCRAVLTEETK